MRKTLRIIIAVISLLTAMTSFMIFSFRLSGLKTTGERSSGAEYSILRNALGSLETREGLQDILLRERLLSLYKGSERLLAAQVLDDTGLAAWRMPDGSAYFAKPDDPRSRGGFSAPSGSTIMFTTPLKGGMKLTAIYVTLKRNDFASAAKLPLLIAAIWAMMTLVAFLLLNPETGTSILPEAILTSKGEPLFRKNSTRGKEDRNGKAENATAQPAAKDEAPNPGAAALQNTSEIPQEGHATTPAETPVQAAPTSVEESISGSLQPAQEETGVLQKPETAMPADTAPVSMTAGLAAASASVTSIQQPSSAVPGPGTIEDSLARLEHEISAWTGRQSQSVPGASATPEDTPQPLETQIDDDLVEELETLEEMDEIEAMNGQKEGDRDLHPSLAPESPGTAPTTQPEAPVQDSLRNAGNEAEKELAETMEILQEFEDLDLESAQEPDKTLPAMEESPEKGQVSARFESPDAAERSERPRAEVPEKQDVSSLPMPLSLQDSELETRLGTELARGPKAEISLLLIHCTVSSRSDPAAVALAVTIKDYIGSKELVFELYKGAFAVVLPSVDLGGALKMSEDLADVLAATLSLYRDLEGEAPVYIGISARSERNVDAFKLYREASTAVHKAYSGGHSRILAFRARNDQL
jgi:hypothetical protein